MTNVSSKGEKGHTPTSNDVLNLDRERKNEPRAIEPRRYRQIVVGAGIFLALIVLTGAAVRLTESGLGCEDWPACSEDEVVPEWQFHSWIEFGNRLLSGVVAAAVGVAALAAYRRRPRRQDLINLAWGLVAVVVIQILLGGATVLLDLHPLVVGVHFLFSMLLLWNVVVLWVRAEPENDIAATDIAATDIAMSGSVESESVGRIESRRVLNLSRAVMGLAIAAGLLGILVTGTGPHGGDARADRLPFNLQTIARVHSAAVWLFLAAAVVLALSLHQSIGRSERHGLAARTSRFVLMAAVSQGVIGYTQYLTGVPPLLVELHILGAIAVWVTVVLLHERVAQLYQQAARHTDQPTSESTVDSI